MKVWVIMGNDFPNGVCSSEELAKAAVKELKEKDRQRIEQSYGTTVSAYHPGIYYRATEFTLNEVS